MLSFNSTNLGSVTPLGLYAGYLLVDSGNLWVGAAFLAVSLLCFVLSMSFLCRLIINYRRSGLINSSAGVVVH